jgi:hypothetical protein
MEERVLIKAKSEILPITKREDEESYGALNVASETAWYFPISSSDINGPSVFIPQSGYRVLFVLSAISGNLAINCTVLGVKLSALLQDQYLPQSIPLLTERKYYCCSLSIVSHGLVQAASSLLSENLQGYTDRPFHVAHFDI